jgi:hypothetical protein
MHARNSVSLSSLSSLNLSTPSGSPSPPGGGIANQNMENSGPLMLSMQYSNNNLSQQHQYSSHQHGLRSRYNLKHNSSNHHKRNRRLSGTFIPEHHLITVPPSQTAKNILSRDNSSKVKSIKPSGPQSSSTTQSVENLEDTTGVQLRRGQGSRVSANNKKKECPSFIQLSTQTRRRAQVGNG